MIGFMKSFLLFIFTIIAQDIFPQNIGEKIVFVAFIYMALNLTYSVYDLFNPLFEYHDIFIYKEEHTNPVTHRVEYESFKDFFCYRVIGAICFWISLIIIYLILFAFRPISSTQYRVSHIYYYNNEEVVVRTGFGQTTTKTVDYAFYNHYNEETKEIEKIEITKDNRYLIEENPLQYRYAFTDGTELTRFSIKGIVLDKPKTPGGWIFKSIANATVHIFQLIYTVFFGC